MFHSYRKEEAAILHLYPRIFSPQELSYIRETWRKPEHFAAAAARELNWRRIRDQASLAAALHRFLEDDELDELFILDMEEEDFDF